MSVERQIRPLRYLLAAVALVLFAVLLRVGVERLIDALAAGSASWLPTVGTTGQTVAVYALAANLCLFVLLPAGIFWLGIRYGRTSARRPRR
jgi:uncharacterized membrane protein YhaH (DUF805 family)